MSRFSRHIFALGATSIGTLVWLRTRSSIYNQELVNSDNGEPWYPPSREEILKTLKKSSTIDTEFDLLIIGGGATGTGCALDASLRGLKVACIEKDDFSSGTSSKSTKLVHGGVRYLEKAVLSLDLEQFDMVREALSERSAFLKLAPYLAHELPIMVPVYNWLMVPYYYAGTKAYDLLAGLSGFPGSYFLSKKRALEEFPMLRKEGLAGAIVYYDGIQNDSRMNVALALSAIKAGATVTNHVEVVDLVKENGKITGAKVKDLISGHQWDVRAKGVINATGPFTDAIRKMDDPNCEEIVAPSSGVHIVLPGYYSPRHMGLVDPSTSDGRVIFFLPWEGGTIAGTTDEPTKVEFDPKPSEKEINFVLNEVSKYLTSDIRVKASDVKAAWSGIRPLVKDPAAKNTESLVRNHMINVSSSGLLTDQTIEKAVEIFNLKPSRKCQTNSTLVIGSKDYSPSMYIKLVQQYGLDEQTAKHLSLNYGDRSFLVAAMTESNPTQQENIFCKRLHEKHPILEAEVRFAARHEYAMNPVDFLARRSRLAFVDCKAALECLPKVVEIMSQELGWNKDRKAKETENAIRFMDTMGLSFVQKNEQSFSYQMNEIKKQFDAFDLNKDGKISIDEAFYVLKKMEVDLSEAEINEAFKEVDLNKDGYIDFKEFYSVMSSVKEIQKQSALSRALAMKK